MRCQNVLSIDERMSGARQPTSFTHVESSPLLLRVKEVAALRIAALKAETAAVEARAALEKADQERRRARSDSEAAATREEGLRSELAAVLEAKVGSKRECDSSHRGLFTHSSAV